MLSARQRLAAIALARMSDLDREHALKRGHIMVSLERSSISGVWTPVNLDADVVTAAHDMYVRGAGQAAAISAYTE